jgi:NAD(P)-dependent dehydrogenase (short-subunit alcohol dehydrogenase family)
LIENLNNFDVSSALETNRQNLLPFLLIAKLAKNLSSGSLVISFSGAGVGGSNLDDSSIGYLGAKASMSILIESFDRQLAERNIRIGLVSPGAFQSPMQRAVARANDLVIPISRINSAKQLEEEPSSPEKLITLLKYLIENPRLLGGRSWSANFDKLGVKDMNAEFGRMRRVY